MSSLQRLQISRRAVDVAFQPSSCRPVFLAASRRLSRLNQPRQPFRHSSSTADPPKTIVLEEPDKFRPPSHPQRMSRRPPRQYPGPPISEAQRESQKTRRYPHMFPNEGTLMHWFLTNKMIHLFITIGTLAFLAIAATLQTWFYTSPFSHLVPSLRTLPFHPITYFSEWWNIFVMHTDYVTSITAERRRHNGLDVQKQRLFRRANGIEDLDMDEEHGVDVRGLVPWDDGLTKKERAAGGRDPNLTTKMIHEVKTRDADGNWVYVRDLVQKEYTRDALGNLVRIPKVEEPVQLGENSQPKAPEVIENAGSKSTEVAEGETPKGTRRKVKRWFGIWE